MPAMKRTYIKTCYLILHIFKHSVLIIDGDKNAIMGLVKIVNSVYTTWWKKILNI